jgi:hypothetical protein
MAIALLYDPPHGICRITIRHLSRRNRFQDRLERLGRQLRMEQRKLLETSFGAPSDAL